MTWELRMPQCCRPSLLFSRKQQWIFGSYRSATCSFSKSSGAVRYIPKNLKQGRPRKQDEPENSRLNQPIGEVGASTRRKLPLQGQECLADAKITRPSAEVSGCLQKDTDLPSTSESTKLRSFDFVEPQIYVNHVPVSSTTDLGRQHLSYASHRANGDGEETIIWPSRATQQTTARGNANSAELLSVNSATLAMPVVPTTCKGVEESFEAREEGVRLLNAERKASSKFIETSSYIAHIDEPPTQKQVGLPRRKQELWQDAESFLLKIQRSKTKSSVHEEMPHIRPTDDRNAGGNDGIANKEEFTEQTRSLHGNPQSTDSHSTAEREHAKNQAICCLAMRPLTAAQLREKLIGRKIAPILADYAVATVQRCGLQNDATYAETFSSSHFDNGGWGPQKIRQVLKRRGIRDEIIKVSIEKVFHEEEANTVPDSAQEEADALRSKGVDISKGAMDHLLVLAAKKWNQGKNVTIETKVRRMISWLQYRGFSYSVIKHVLWHMRKGLQLEN